MDIQKFYAESHIRDLFGATEGRPNAHRGVDIGGWLTGTPVPAWCEGTVVTSEWQSGLGWVVAVDSIYGFAGVSHLDEQGARVGDFVSVNEPWGPLGNTGSLSEGPHGHMTLSLTSRFPWAGPTIDPLPYIRAARDGSASAGGGIELITPGDEDMKLFADSQTNKWYLVGPGVFRPVQSAMQAPYIAAYGNRIAVTTAELNQIHADVMSARSNDFSVFANVDTNAWVVGGPGFWQVIPSGQGGTFEALYGSRIPVTDAQFKVLRDLFV